MNGEHHLTLDFGEKEKNEKLITYAQKDKNVTEVQDTNGGSGGDIKNPFDDMSGKLVTDTQMNGTNGAYINEEKGDGVLNDEYVINTLEDKNAVHESNRNGVRGHGLTKPFNNMLGDVVKDTENEDKNVTHINGVKNPFINMFEDTQEDNDGTNVFNSAPIIFFVPATVSL